MSEPATARTEDPTISSPPRSASQKASTPPATPEPAQAPVRFATYKVEEGDSLWTIAVRLLKDGTRWVEILEANPQLKGRTERLRTGEEIRVPTGPPKKAVAEATPRPPGSGRHHKVVQGDTLWDLAKKFYGDASQHVLMEILAANPGLDPAALPVGKEIRLPELPGRGPKELAGG